MFMLRFDLRAPGADANGLADLYTAAIEMAEWGEEHGGVAVVLSEHHGSPDGYLPSPLVLAAAIAARTTTIPITVAAFLLPLHDPVRAAEDMIVLDVISRGRAMHVIGLGYRPEEFAMFGQDVADRADRMDHCLAALQQALREESFDLDGRPVTVTPRPYTPGGPMLFYGGGSKAAARRAARFGLGFFAQHHSEGLDAYYREQCRAHGHEPGLCVMPAPGSATSVFVARDVDAAWERLGPYLLHDARVYAEWLGATDAASKSTATTIAALRAEGGAYRILTPEQAVAEVRRFGVLGLHPLCGGLPPELAWESLHLVADEVLPALR